MARTAKTAAEKARQYWQGQLHAHVVERRTLSVPKWQRVFERLLTDLQTHLAATRGVGGDVPAGGIDPREPLLWAWCVLLSMPEEFGQHYRRLQEGSASPSSGIEGNAAELRAADYAWTGLKTARTVQVEWLAAVVRGLDADLAGIDYWPRRREGWSVAAWQPDGYPCYIVPVQRNYRLELGKERERRATRYHAVVPIALGDLEVELTLHDQVAKAEREAPAHFWKYGAAVFPDLKLTVHEIGEDQFLLDEAKVADDQGIIAAQIGQALTGRCDVLAWPELTMPEGRVEAVRAGLRADPLGDPRRIPIVVAGSWHVADGADHYNRSEVLTARGKPLATCDKRRVFQFGGRYEAIRAGHKVPVIVMEDRLVAIAICLDFCDDCGLEVYRHLGVDLVIVPSMGDDKTVDAHERHAKILQSQQGSITLVVQQHPVLESKPDPAAPPGYSFTQGAPRSAPAVEQRAPFRSLEARR